MESDDSAFCSDTCAVKMAPDLYQALLLARTQLCRALWSSKHHHRSPMILDGPRASPQATPLEPPPSDPSVVWGVSLADMQALESKMIKPTQAIGEITGAMERRQLITKLNPSSTLGALTKGGMKGEKGKDDLLVAAETKEQEPDQESKGLMLLQQLLEVGQGQGQGQDKLALVSGRTSLGSMGGGSTSNESPSGAAPSPRSSSAAASGGFPSSSSASNGLPGTPTAPFFPPIVIYTSNLLFSHFSMHHVGIPVDNIEH